MQAVVGRYSWKTAKLVISTQNFDHFGATDGPVDPSPNTKVGRQVVVGLLPSLPSSQDPPGPKLAWQ